jgi:hypothetical protein
LIFLSAEWLPIVNKMDVERREKIYDNYNKLYTSLIKNLEPKNNFRLNAPCYAIKYAHDPSLLASADETGLINIIAVGDTDIT